MKPIAAHSLSVQWNRFSWNSPETLPSTLHFAIDRQDLEMLERAFVKSGTAASDMTECRKKVAQSMSSFEVDHGELIAEASQTHPTGEQRCQ
jgi:hypothetical protein